MSADIKTIFFDVGNTLRIVLPDQPFMDAAEAELMKLIQTTESHDELFAKLEKRWKAYRGRVRPGLLEGAAAGGCGAAAGNLTAMTFLSSNRLERPTPVTVLAGRSVTVGVEEQGQGPKSGYSGEWTIPSIGQRRWSGPFLEKVSRP